MHEKVLIKYRMQSPWHNAQSSDKTKPKEKLYFSRFIEEKWMFTGNKLAGQSCLIEFEAHHPSWNMEHGTYIKSFSFFIFFPPPQVLLPKRHHLLIIFNYAWWRLTLHN